MHPRLYRGYACSRGVTATGSLAVNAAIVTGGCLFNSRDPGLFPPCPFRALTGFHCPGCGTLRGLHQLLHGHLLGALSFNPLMVLFLPFLGYAVLSNAVFSTGGRRLPGFRLPATGIWLLLGAIILFWILRNVPAYPFSMLAP